MKNSYIKEIIDLIQKEGQIEVEYDFENNPVGERTFSTYINQVPFLEKQYDFTLSSQDKSIPFHLITRQKQTKNSNSWDTLKLRPPLSIAYQILQSFEHGYHDCINTDAS